MDDLPPSSPSHPQDEPVSSENAVKRKVLLARVISYCVISLRGRWEQIYMIIKGTFFILQKENIVCIGLGYI